MHQKMKRRERQTPVKPVTMEDRTMHCKWQGGTRSE